MPKLPIKGLPSQDSGRLMVRLNYKHRTDIKRYGIAIIENELTKKSVNVLVLGHNDCKAIFMPYDIRTSLGADKSEILDFSIRKARFYEVLSWYVGSPDPAVGIPAKIAVFGLVLAIIGLFLTFRSY